MALGSKIVLLIIVAFIYEYRLPILVKNTN